MFKCIVRINVGVYSRFKWVSALHRYYRTKHRKKVTIELNKPSLYDHRRNAPSKLLKANLFTPESAGYRELSMLCFWIVNYGYADYSILTRYVQCAIDKIKRLKIKGIALILHSVSKYLYDNDISIVESHQIEDSESEYRNRQTLIVKCVKMIIESAHVLPSLFVNAVPKDLGMISLSIMNIYQMYINECNIDNFDFELKKEEQNHKDSISQPNAGMSIGPVINKLLQRLSQEIIPKMPFCELDEFAAFAKSFSKINTDWSSHFMRELSHEVSSLLMEKIEDLEMLAQNKFIGEDLIEQLNKLPRDLSTITCSISKCRLSESKFWERSNRLISLLIDMKDRKFGIGEVDIVTLTLLCTSMCKYADVRKIVEQMLKGSSNEDQSAILVGFNTCVSILKDELMAEKFLNKLNICDLMNMNTRLVSKFILNYAKIGLAENAKVSGGIMSLLDNELEEHILCSIYMARKSLKIPMDVVISISNRLSANLNNIETHILLNILMSSVEVVADRRDSVVITSGSTNRNSVESVENRGFSNNNQIKTMCAQLIQILCNRLDQIPLRMLLPLLSVVLAHFGGNLKMISRICKKIDENINDFDMIEIGKITNEMSSMGLNVNKLFNKNIMKIKESGTPNQDYEFEFPFDPHHQYDNLYATNNVTNPTHDNNYIYDVNSIQYFELNSTDLLDDTNCGYNTGIGTEVNANSDSVCGTDGFDNNDNDMSHSTFKFNHKDQSEIAAIAKCNLTKNDSVSMLNLNDFTGDYDNSDADNTFQLIKYPSDTQERGENQDKYKKLDTPNTVHSRSLKAVSRSTTIEDLKSEWSQLRQSVQ